MEDSAFEPVYPNNANFTSLEFVNKLLHFKNKHNCSNNDFDELFHLIESIFLDDPKLLEYYYVMRKMIRGMNMRYEKIDACENDCMLFYKKIARRHFVTYVMKVDVKSQKDPKK